MHHAQSLIVSMGAGGVFLNHPLSAMEAKAVEGALLVDAENYLYSACVSIGDAVQAIDRSLFTWATVKLYYSIFYLLRALLALSGRALVYEATKPRTLLCKSGESPIVFAGAKGTHQAVISYYAKSFPRSLLLSQEIMNDSAFKWLMLLREEANYTMGRFSDPKCPPHFRAIVQFGVRRSAAQYISDDVHLYAFDPDHAILALPIEALKMAVRHPNLDISANKDAEVRSFFKKLFAHKSGPMQDVLSLLRI